MGILWYVYIQRKYVHQTCVCCVFFISDLPISSTNTPDNSPLATCDDSKFQDIEKQLRDSDKNPVGCIGWWAACPNSLGDRVFQPTSGFFGFLGEVKTKSHFGPENTPMVRRWILNSCPPFFRRLPLQLLLLRSVDLRSHLQAAWGTQQQVANWQVPKQPWCPTNWQVRKPPFFHFSSGFGRAFYCADFQGNLFGGGENCPEFFFGFEGCSLCIERIRMRHWSPHDFGIQDELHDESPISSTCWGVIAKRWNKPPQPQLKSFKSCYKNQKNIRTDQYFPKKSLRNSLIRTSFFGILVSQLFVEIVSSSHARWGNYQLLTPSYCICKAIHRGCKL